MRKRKKEREKERVGERFQKNGVRRIRDAMTEKGNCN